MHDGAAITRVLAYYPRASRRSLFIKGKPNVPRVSEVLRRALDLADKAGVRRLVLVTFQKLQEALEGPGTLKSMLDQWKSPGRKIALLHYGALTGLDSFREFDGLVTIGDHWPNKQDVFEVAELVGVEPNPYYRKLVAAELEQAHGRLRDVSRTTPAWHLHVGAVAPARWHAGNTTVLQPRRGRPVGSGPRQEVVDQVNGAVALHGAQWVQERLGVSARTLRRYLAGTAGPSPAQLDGFGGGHVNAL
jgi:hypothetical protein